MNPKTFVDALLGFVITFGTSVGALLAQNGVGSLGDVSSAAWWAALAGALVATAKTVQSRLSDPNADTKSSSQAGFLRLPALIPFAAMGAGLLALQLTACSMQFRSQNAIAAASMSIEQMAKEVGAAQKNGQISIEKEQELLGRLQAANNELRQLQYTLSTCMAEECPQASALETITTALVLIRNDLAASEKGQ